MDAHDDLHDKGGEAAAAEDAMTDPSRNPDLFLDCVAAVLAQRLALSSPATTAASSSSAGRRKRRGRRKSGAASTDAPSTATEAAGVATTSTADGASTGDDETDPEDLAEFAEYVASEVFASLPEELRTLTYAAARNDDALAARCSDAATLDAIAAAAPAPALESLAAYGVVPSAMDAGPAFLAPVVAAYVDAIVRAPGHAFDRGQGRAAACEICGRGWVPLTYHHLIPRAVHEKALRKGWHDEWRLNVVAWLCRQCHAMVHRVASNEELARGYYTVEMLLGREDVRRFAGWVGRVRWKKR